MKHRLLLLFSVVLCVVQAEAADSLDCRLLGRFPNPTDWHLGYNQFAVAGGYAYMPARNQVSGEASLYVIDVRNPASPSLVGQFDRGLTFECVAVDGDYGYLGGSNLMWVVDVSTPSDPREVGSCVMSGPPQHITKYGNYVYSGGWWSGLDVVDVSDPENPALVGHCATGDKARGIAISLDANYAYVADQESGLCVVDVSNKADPRVLSLLPGPRFGEDEALVAGTNHVFEANATSLRMIDVSDPDSPFVAAVYDPDGAFQSIDVVGDRAYVAADARGLLVVDISTPTNPQTLGYWYTYGDSGSGATAVVKNPGDDRTYILDWGAGLLILQFYGDVGVEEGGRPAASPWQSSATVVRGRIQLPQATSHKPQAPDCLLDATGRRVMELRPGPNDVHRLSPGVYFISGPKSVQRLVLAP